MTGLTPAQARGPGWIVAIHPDDRERVALGWQEAVKRGGASNAEYRFRRADGSVTWVQGQAVQLRDSAGQLAGYIGTIADFTQRMQAEEKLRESETQLQAHAAELERKVDERTASLREAILQMEEFSYSVSHDLRAPLRAMNAYAQALAEDYGDQLDETAKGYLERIQRSSQRMEKLTHDVLTYSRVTQGDVELAPVDVLALLEDLVGQYSELQPPAAELEIGTPLHSVRAHESSLGQCLANLLTNAAKFVAPGVRPRIRVHSETVDDCVRIWIEDNGIGVDPRYQVNLFRAFERVPTQHPYDGTGIGLAVVRKAAEKMGGRCGVVSDGRNGSRFWIEVPKA
jgi:PAS domain S-box-containing protein